MLGGGFARGRHTELFGAYSVGKTYLSYRLIASAQQLGLECAYVDAERTFEPVFAKRAGVDLGALVYDEQRASGEQLVDHMEALLRSGNYGVIVLDSIAALLPLPETENSMEKTTMGTARAKLMSRALPRLTVANNDTVLVYINQLRDSMSMFSKATTSGGRAMAFYAGTRLEMVRTEVIKRKSQVVDPKKLKAQESDVVKGHRVMARVEKDKTGGQHYGASASFVFDYDIGGVDKTEELIYLGMVMDLVKRKGDKFWVEGYEEDAQVYAKKFHSWLNKNTAVAEELEENIMAVINESSSLVG